ncbi:MAG: YCF48-related protein [Bacteroidota bacterium]
MKNFTSFLFLLLLAQPSFAQWEASTIGFDDPLNIWSMDAVDADVAWAITTDGTYSGDVWAISTSKTFARTADGGATWKKGEVPLPSNSYGLWKVSAVDANTAWVAASNPFTLGAAIFKTADGGDTWTQQDVFSSASFCTVIHFWDTENGIAIGDPLNNVYEIYSTNDGGETWEAVGPENIPAPQFSWEYVSTSVCSVVEDHIWFGTYGSRVFHSADRGLTWTASETPIASITSNPWVEGLTFSDELKGIAYSADYSAPPYQHLIALTEDGGATWVEQAVEDSDFAIFKAQYIAGTNLLIKTSRASNGNGPYATSISYNNGISWTDIETSTPIADFEFIDQATAWAGKFKNNDEPTAMYKFTGDALTGLFVPQPLEAELKVGPNPVIDEVAVEIRTQEESQLTLRLFAANGRLILQRQLDEAQFFNEVLALGDLPRGTYTLSMENAKGEQLSRQLIKQ